MSPKGPLHFLIFGKRMDVQNSHFLSDIGFSQCISNTFFQYYLNFFKTGVFRYYATFFYFVFIEAPLQFLQETKRLASIEDSLGFSALCDIPETFLQQTGFSKSAKGPPFTIFGIVRFFKMNISRLKIRFSQVQTQVFHTQCDFR